MQYFSLEEQLTQLTAALKEQYGRHCFIKIHHQRTQPLRVPFVKAHYTTQEAFGWYEQKKLAAEGAQPLAAVDEAMARQEQELNTRVGSPSKAGTVPGSSQSFIGRE